MQPGDAVEFDLGRRVLQGTVTRVLKITVWVEDERGKVWAVQKDIVKALDNTSQQS